MTWKGVKLCLSKFEFCYIVSTDKSITILLSSMGIIASKRNLTICKSMIQIFIRRVLNKGPHKTKHQINCSSKIVILVTILQLAGDKEKQRYKKGDRKRTRKTLQNMSRITWFILMPQHVHHLWPGVSSIFITHTAGYKKQRK